LASSIIASVSWISPPAPPLLGRKNVEDVRLEDVAPGDDEVRWRPFPRRFFDHLGDREQAAPALADADHPIHVDAFGRHLLDGNDIRVLAEVARGVDHLAEAAAVVLHQHVGQQQRERLVARPATGKTALRMGVMDQLRVMG
jgi:hypothetical protein